MAATRSPDAAAVAVVAHAGANDAAAAADADAVHDTVARRLAAFAQADPDGVAIRAASGSTSWHALDLDASAIASAIADAAGGRRGNVCLLLDDRASAVKGILGVARQGSAYVPFDADEPEERLRFMLADCEPSGVLAAGPTLDRARRLAPAGCAVIDLDQALRCAPRPLAPVRVDEVAQVYYTSGSTGAPKGVRQTHANQLHFADTYRRRVGVGPGDRQSLLYSIGYAAALGDVYRAMALGATLCVRDLKREGVAGLADWIDREAVTLLHSFPMVFREMAKRIAHDRRFASLRVLQLDGEPAYAGDFVLYRSHTTDRCAFVTQLSATEITLIAQNRLDHGSEVADGAPIPVGTPSEGVRVEVVRADGSPAAAGETGALLVHSRHVSPGYWRRPELDARAFAPDPLDPLGRTYRSGDLGRFDAQGRLHVVGREGTRVKIRAHTVELAEVEAALAGFEGLVAVAVTAEADPDDPAAKRLVAWIEARDDVPRDPVAVRRYLARRLPLHMLPPTMRFVAELPRTSSGKVDRLRLGEAMQLAPQARGFEAPRDAVEAAVAHLFVQMLGVDRAGRDEDFFLAGGDSMMAADLQLRVIEAFGVRIPSFHRDATVADIAAQIRALREFAE